ncbi:MAG TPA: hypothetical protein DD400_01780 [Rhodospirillaceae bacterium]|nr:hypothetical protein [Rhodospirillaceae bacterium]
MPQTNIRYHYSEKSCQDAARAFRRIVFWGLTGGVNGTHTHRHVFRAYFDTCRAFDIETAWLSDQTQDPDLSPDDLVFVHGLSANLDQVLKSGAAIVDFHNWILKDLGDPNYEALLTYERRLSEADGRLPKKTKAEKWDLLTLYDPERRILSQPWGSDLLGRDFKEPALNTETRKVFWIGNWWHSDAEDWGNLKEIAALRDALAKHGLQLVLFNNCDRAQNALFVRESRLGPSIAGAGQVKENHLACRFFKNISYGQFALSNVPMAEKFLESNLVYSPDIHDLIDKAMALSPKEAKEMVLFQQEKIKPFTIAAHLYLLFLAVHTFCPRGGTHDI